MNKIAIIFSSKHGTTAQIAEMIAERFADVQATAIDLKTAKQPDLSSFDTVILGTAVYAGQSMRAMRSFCKTNAATLLQKPLALFVCGMEPNVEKQSEELSNAYPVELREHAAVKQFIPGAFCFEKMNFFERAIIRKISKVDKSMSLVNEDIVDSFIKNTKQNEVR